ncbi:MAG: hypothetical protein ACRCXA_13620 [Peptostreptococcaceae bacterium]
MKKITLLAVLGLILLILINPSKISVSSNSKKGSDTIKEINTLEVVNLNQYINYKGRLCLVDDKYLKIIDEDGNEVYKQQIQPGSIKLSSGNLIDIINKTTNRCSSINEDGKTQFATDSSLDTFLYKSISKYVFTTASKSDENETLKILNDEGGVTQKIEIKGKTTNIKSINDMVLLSYISVDKSIVNKLAVYDQNGNLKNETEFNDIILDIININENLYLFFENKIQILDANLKQKDEISIEGIKSIEQSFNDNIFIQNSKGEFSVIEDGKLKNVKTIKDKELKIEGIGNSYVLYSDKAIYNDKLKEIKTFNQDIKDIKAIGDSSFAIIFEDNIRIYNLK